SLMISMKALRSSDSAMAWRNSALSKGGLSRLTSICRGMFQGTVSQTAWGALPLSSFINGSDRIPCAKRSKLPLAKANIAVEGLATKVYSMPSRYGHPFFQYSVFLVTLIDSFGLNSTNLKGPV